MTVDTDSSSLIHGPIKTRRLGTALTLDVTAPQQTMVVERGSQLPKASLVVTTAARRIIELSKAGDKVESIVVVGSDLDPSAHPDLREITENVRALRDKWFSRAKLCIVTRATDLGSYDLRATLSMYNRLFFQFEWGTAKVFQAATGEKSTVLNTLTRQLGGFGHVIVQANFFKGDTDNSTDAEVSNWIKKLQELKPQEVHILSGIGDQDGKKRRAVTPRRRELIAAAVAERTGLNVSIHDDEPLLV